MLPAALKTLILMETFRFWFFSYFQTAFYYGKKQVKQKNRAAFLFKPFEILNIYLISVISQEALTFGCTTYKPDYYQIGRGVQFHY